MAQPRYAADQGARLRRIPPAQGTRARGLHALFLAHRLAEQGGFEAWTRSEEFRAAHKDAGQNKPLYIGHPELEGFEVRQTVRQGATAVA